MLKHSPSYFELLNGNGIQQRENTDRMRFVAQQRRGGKAPTQSGDHLSAWKMPENACLERKKKKNEVNKMSYEDYASFRISFRGNIKIIL